MSTPDTLEDNIDNGAETVNQPKTNQDSQKNIIPTQYDGLPSKVVEELWTNPIYSDEEKNQAETERRQNAIDQIKANENLREETKRNQLTAQYSQLPDDDKDKFPEAQNDAMKIAHEYIKGERELTGLSKEEQFVLDKLKSAYKNFKKENPDKKFPFQLASDIDKQVWDNLNYNLAFDVLNSQKQIADQEEANKIREEIGISTQDINSENLLSPKETQEEGVENFDSKIKDEYRKYAKEYYTKIQKTTEEEADNLINRSENLDSTALTKGTIEKMYFLIRLHDYKQDENHDDKIEEITKNSTDKINSHSENGWHYRVPYYEKDGAKYHKTNKASFRVSLNVNANEDLVNKLDEYISSVSQKPGSVYYKTPQHSSNWLERHDPITIYFEEDISDEIKKDIVDITKPFIRSEDDVLPGEKLSGGVVYESSPSEEKLTELVKRGYDINQEAGDAIRGYITKDERLKASAGQVSAIEKFLKEFGKKK